MPPSWPAYAYATILGAGFWSVRREPAGDRARPLDDISRSNLGLTPVRRVPAPSTRAVLGIVRRCDDRLAMEKSEITTDDQVLIDAARTTIDRLGNGSTHTVAAAIRAKDGTVFSGVNVFAQGGGADAELVVLGIAISSGLTDFATIVAVGDRGRGVVPPCGVCRQLLLDYAPGIDVITEFEGTTQKRPITDLIPLAYRSWFAE